MKFKKTLIALGATAGALTLIACGGGTKGSVSHSDSASQKSAAVATEQPKIATGKVGDTITLTHGTDEVEVTVSPIAKYAGDDYLKAENAAQYSYVHVTINAVNGKYSANPLNFALVGVDGAHYRQAVFGSPEPQLNAAELVAGQKMAGNIGWDVSDAVLAGAQVQVDGTGLDMLTTAGIWKLS